MGIPPNYEYANFFWFPFTEENPTDTIDGIEEVVVALPADELNPPPEPLPTLPHAIQQPNVAHEEE